MMQIPRIEALMLKMAKMWPRSHPTFRTFVGKGRGSIFRVGLDGSVAAERSSLLSLAADQRGDEGPGQCGLV